MLVLLLPLALAGARPVSAPTDGNCQSPAWSPDGANLAYEVNYHDRKAIDLFVYTPGEGDPRQVRPVQRSSSSLTAGFSGAGGEERVAHEASWAPTSIGRLVYSASTGGRDYDLFIDGGGALAAGPDADGGPVWSPDGAHIAFTSARSGQGDLYLIDTAQIDAPPRQLTTAPESSEVFAAWSPDGRRLAYVGHTSSGDNLYLIDDVAAPSPRRVTGWNHTQTRPSWSPDGKSIAFYSNHADPDRFDLYVMEVGREARRVVEGVLLNPRGPSWTPDSAAIITVRDDDARYDPVWIVPIADPSRARAVPTGTIGNGDLDVVRGTDGRVWLAVTAQGRESDEVRDFKRVFVMELGL